MLLQKKEKMALSSDYDSVIENFHHELELFLHTFFIAYQNNQLNAMTKIVEQFYSQWLYTKSLPYEIRGAFEKAISAALTPLVMICMSAQVAYVCHYALNIACGLTMLYFVVGIKVTTPNWASMGILSRGMFHVKSIKTTSSFRGANRRRNPL